MELTEEKILKLDLGCGDYKTEGGFVGVDIKSYPSVDKQVDLFQFPWPWEDGSVDEISCRYLFHLVPREIRGKFMEEVYRILKPGAKIFLIVPHAASYRSIFDRRTEWPPLIEQSFIVFDKNWRIANKHDDDLNCDFNVVLAYSISNEKWASRHDDAKDFAVQHYRNIVDDIHVTLIKR